MCQPITRYGSHVYLKLRRVPSRFYGEPATYEAKIIGRREASIWDVLGTSRGHATIDDARAAGLRLADKRGIKIKDDPRELRAVEFRDRYGDDT